MTISPESRRRQFCTVTRNIKRYDVSAAGDLSQFSDADTISPYAIAPLQWAVAEEVIEGMDDGAIAPKAHTTRAQVANHSHAVRVKISRNKAINIFYRGSKGQAYFRLALCSASKSRTLPWQRRISRCSLSLSTVPHFSAFYGAYRTIHKQQKRIIENLSR